ncbi:protein-disulfide reductase DsbD N-terminal domain-containing protein [Desertivirga arenae]|uniref:protein-disulfide reductase DsbD N-terminal domain-containing protein n=1 Tax=Desertivirga arenae TaxID=2810309 RepID=UPI001A975FCB|nr:protein-disulfide reductase DsbD N-terminal domain-containing protein [Pedobacter sp. SYSU D00823]
MKKTILALVAFLVVSVSAGAQILNPVKWSYAAKRIGKDEAMVLVKATIEPGWHLYSQTIADGGPVKTTFSFNTSPAYTLIGKTIEPKPVVKFEKVFDMKVAYFENSVIFQQKVKLKAKQATVKGNVEFMVCNDEKCLPPDTMDFSVAVK